MDLSPSPTFTPSLRRHPYLEILRENPASSLFSNIETEAWIENGYHGPYPITKNQAEWTNAFVASPLAQNILYAQEELPLLKNQSLEWGLMRFLKTAEAAFKRVELGRVVQINNWLLSTNHFSDWNWASSGALAEFWAHRFPTHALMMRSVPDQIEIHQELLRAGFLLQKQRRVFLFDGRNPQYLRKEPLQRDLKWMKKNGFQILDHEQIPQTWIPEFVRLYRSLYIEKHSRWNPDFSPHFVSELFLRQGFRFKAVVDSENHCRGVIALLETSDLISTSFLGYDTNSEADQGLYRILAAIALTYAAERGKLLNYSSGAAEFKRRRGGEAAWDITAIYVKHLPMKQRLGWKSLVHAANQIAAPLIERYQL